MPPLDHRGAPTRASIGSALWPRRRKCSLNSARGRRSTRSPAGPHVGPGTLYRHFPNRSALLTAVLKDRIESLCGRAEALLSSESADDALAHWLRAFLTHARVNQGMGSALMIGEPDAPGFDCHQLILDAATGLLTRAQQRGTARTDLTADDLVQLVVGVALSTARSEDEEQSERLLALVLDAVRGRPLRSE